MDRKTNFALGEYYHLYSRGVEKRKLFLKPGDYERFVALLYIMNQPDPFRMDNFLQSHNNDLKSIFNEKRDKTLVSIVSYCLMPNHFHIMVYEHAEGGISKFMSKLLTAYSMYFNTKFQRSGPLFTRPFRSQHVSNEPQFLYLFSYIHLNPLSIIEPEWKEGKINNYINAQSFFSEYPFSSYADFASNLRPEAKILDKNMIPEYIRQDRINLKKLLEDYSKNKE